MQNSNGFFHNIDYEDKILFNCTNGYASSFAYGQLLENLKAASIQMDRIWSYAKTIKNPLGLTLMIPIFNQNQKNFLNQKS
jgi:hypothetical protein